MIRPEEHVVQGIANAVLNHKELLMWLESQQAHELKRLPYAVDSPAVYQGRCQMLAELIEFAKEAPAIAAKLRSSPSNHAHR